MSGINSIISMDKEYRTKQGDKVRIYAIDGASPYPVHGAILLYSVRTNTKEWRDYSWSCCGDSRTNNSIFDLVEIPKETEHLFHAYSTPDGLKVVPDGTTVSGSGMPGTGIKFLGTVTFILKDNEIIGLKR